MSDSTNQLSDSRVAVPARALSSSAGRECYISFFAIVASIVGLSTNAFATPIVDGNSPLDTFAERPIPILAASAKSALDYHSIKVNLSAPQSKESLVAISNAGVAGEAYYARVDKLNAPYFRALPGACKTIYLRESLIKALQRANEMLSKDGLEVYVLDGYRDQSTQRALWAFFMDKGRQLLKTDNKNVLRAFAGRYCSDPGRYKESDARTWPTHITGGAVDLTLRRKSTGELLFMGGIFDDPSPISHTSYFEVPKKAGTSKFRDNSSSNSLSVSSSQSEWQSFLEARRNRRLLYWCMSSCGFANYPFEWWHYDLGTQMYVQNKKAELFTSPRTFTPKFTPIAVYGPAKPINRGHGCQVEIAK